MWTWALIFSFMALVGEKPRLGVVDIKAESELPGDKEKLLNEVRQEFQWQAIFELLNQDQINVVQQKIDPREIEQKALREKEVQEWETFKSLLQRGRQFYSESRFDESLAILNNALSVLPRCGLAIELSLIDDFLAYKAANEFFLSNQKASRNSLIWRNFLTDKKSLDPQKFPPRFIALDLSIKEENLTFRNQLVTSEPKNLSVWLLGKNLKTQLVEDKIEFELPKSPDFFSSMRIFFLKEGFVPQSMPISRIPKSIKLEAYERTERVKEDVFNILGSVAPSSELIEFVKNRDLDAILLMNASSNLRNEWIVRGQIFRLRNLQKSPVVEVVGKETDEIAKVLVRRLLLFVDKDGDIIEPANSDFKQETYVELPITKKWWFWTLVGVGVAGAGTAGYFLLKPEEQLKFSVRAKGD